MFVNLITALWSKSAATLWLPHLQKADAATFGHS